jgi:hypothetical protein
MAKLVEAETGSGTVLFEVEELPGERTERVSRRGHNVVAELDERLDDAISTIRPAAESIFEAFGQLGPDTVSVEFGLKLDAEAGAIIAKTGVSGHFTVSLTWTPSMTQPNT